MFVEKKAKSKDKVRFSTKSLYKLPRHRRENDLK